MQSVLEAPATEAGERPATMAMRGLPITTGIPLQVWRQAVQKKYIRLRGGELLVDDVVSHLGTLATRRWQQAQTWQKRVEYETAHAKALEAAARYISEEYPG